MGRMSELYASYASIQEDLEYGLSLSEIATKHEVPYSWVEKVAKDLQATRDFNMMDMDSQYIIENDYMDDY
jgi:hypothetical protein